MKFILDTNTCVYIIKRKPLDVIERFNQIKISQIGISSITLSELLYGVSKSSKPEQNQIALTQFVAPLEILPYGHALSTDCILVTNNEKEFIRIPNLKINNWIK